MLQLGKDEARRLITGAAYSYKGYLQNPTVTVRIAAFSGVHGAPLQRFYNLLCIGYGADPDLFADLVDNGYLPAQRARGCRVEFGEVNFAFQQTMLSHVDRELAKAILARDWIPETVFGHRRPRRTNRPGLQRNRLGKSDVRCGLFASVPPCLGHVRLSPNRDRIADIAALRICAISRHSAGSSPTHHIRLDCRRRSRQMFLPEEHAQFRLNPPKVQYHP